MPQAKDIKLIRCSIITIAASELLPSFCALIMCIEFIFCIFYCGNYFWRPQFCIIRLWCWIKYIKCVKYQLVICNTSAMSRLWQKKKLKIQAATSQIHKIIICYTFSVVFTSFLYFFPIPWDCLFIELFFLLEKNFVELTNVWQVECSSCSSG